MWYPKKVSIIFDREVAFSTWAMVCASCLRLKQVTRIFPVISALALTGGSVNSYAQESAKAGAAGQKFTLKFLFGFAQGASSSTQAGVDAMQAKLKDLSNGGVEMNSRGGGVLGSEAQMLESVQLGTLNAAALSSPVLTSILPKMSVFDLPYIWRDLDHFFTVIDGPLTPNLTKGSETKGFLVLSQWVGGVRNMYGNKPVYKVEDLKGVKIRILQSPVFLESFKAMGAIPAPITWPETYQALQMGTVDAAETVLPAMIDARQYEVSKFVIISRHAINPMSIVVNAKWFNGLPQNVQVALLESFKAGQIADRAKYVTAERDAIKLLESKGLKVIQPDLEGFRKVAEGIYRQFSEKIGPETIAAIVAK
jgi:tripartite ATP-independent transporter DctP family solute receptor